MSKSFGVYPESQYYLHTAGSVIFKLHGGVDVDSPFVKKCWNANFLSEGPITFLKWLGELRELGAIPSDLRRLWNSQNMDAWIPADRHDELKGLLGI